MARARNLKPGFFKNEDLAECSFEARLCFAGLWTLADREGRLEDRPKRIKGELFAFDSLDVEPLLAELAQHDFILRYQAEDGRSLIQVLKFLEHQNPHHREPPSELPPPQSPGLYPHGNQPKPGADGGSNGVSAQGQPRASPGLDPPRSDLARGSSLPVEGGVSRAVTGAMNPEPGFRSPESGTLIPVPVPTAYGLVARAIRQAGIEASPGHQGLRALVDAGATVDEFLAYVPKSKGMDKPFAYLVKTVASERERAKQLGESIHRGPMPSAAAAPPPPNPAATWLAEQAERARVVEQQRQARLVARRTAEPT